MELPSAPAHRGHSPWQGLLLAVLLITFWNPPTTAQLTIESVPPNGVQGKDVLLLVHNLTENLIGYGWFKADRVDPNQQIAAYMIDTKEITQGPVYSGRETIYPNGSLLFQNVTQEDVGYYTLQAWTKNFQSQVGTGQLHVYPELTKPNVTCNKSSPVEHEDRVVFTCEPQTQDTTYLWLNNNQSLLDSTWLELSLDNRTLTLLRVTRNDTGLYECETRNPVSARRSDPFYLNVLYGPDAPTISPSDSYYRPGANLSLSCHAASNPPAQYSWFINGRPQQSTPELFIPNITANDSGSYTCLVHNSVTGFNRTTVKTITVSAELTKPNVTCNNSSPVEHEDRVVLTCEAETQDTTYLWLINNQSLLDSTWLELSLDNRTLTLFRVTRNDTGPYECETRNPVSARRSDPFYLNVLYGPAAPTISPSDSYYRAGANLSLSCHAASNPPAQYSWLINGRPQQSTQELFIPNITANDSGSYTCLVHNSVTGFNKTTVKTITVSDPVAQPSIQATNTAIAEHKDAVVLTCLTNDTGISIQWFFNNQSLWLTERVKLSQDNSTLTIDPVRREDAGDYQCEVSNLVSSSRSDLLSLDVKYPVAQPSIEASNTKVTEDKDSVVLTCLTNDTEISIQWFFSNQSLWLTERVKLSQDNSTLTIDPVRREDAGDYQCEVSNLVSSSRSDVLSLDVKCK
ncbi:carcinoembryonic antigen-related cell adhesion molecule 5-like [Diceros bicornis minor]|uniref:carcinoembryonic antigen-related cell adhesion molecule 5-like n=1 Tax=Diceros bicornis minor TaxID=77932 RepID=UPI0026EF0878|nr:carcinoembryonic antigen-related cell adhesion molecule 5-like [Diceros bicornis minor]